MFTLAEHSKQRRIAQASVLSFPSLAGSPAGPLCSRRQPSMSLQSSAMKVSGVHSLMAFFATPTSLLPLKAFSPSHTHPRTRLPPQPQSLPQRWSFLGTPSAPGGGQPQEKMDILSRQTWHMFFFVGKGPSVTECPSRTLPSTRHNQIIRRTSRMLILAEHS
jgi:hypothetical protein